MSGTPDFSLVLQQATALQRDPFASAEFALAYHHHFAPQSHALGGAQVIARLAEVVRPRGRVLEVGAGTGLTADRLARLRPDLSVMATDLHAAMLDVGAQALPPPPNLARQVAPAEALPLPDESVDAVWSVSLLRHLTHRRPAIAEQLRVLRPGGLLLAVDIAPWTPWRQRGRVAQDMPIPTALRPLLVLRTFRDAERQLGSRDDVRALFMDHADAEPFEGLAPLHEADGAPLPCFLAVLRRR